MLGDTLRSYEFPDGSTININRGFAWCRPCAGVVWAEIIPELEELTEPVAIEWRKQRKSPPKCLECGSTEIIPCRAGETNSGKKRWEIDCPVCGGVIRILTEAVLSLDRGWIRYSPEGD